MATKQKLNVKQYFEQLAKETGLDPNVAGAVLGALDNEKFRGKVEEFGMMRSDYSSKQDELSRSKQQLEEEKARWQNWYEKEAKPYVAKARARLEQYEQTFGPIEQITETGDPNVMRTASGDFVSREQVEELLRANTTGMAGAVSQFVKGVTSASIQHFKRFGEELNTDELEQFMQEKGIGDVTVGYKEYIQPKLEELREKELEQKIKDAREEAVREFRSKNHFPDNPQAATTKIPIFEVADPSEGKTAPPSRMSRFEAFTAAMDKARESVPSD